LYYFDFILLMEKEIRKKTWKKTPCSFFFQFPVLFLIYFDDIFF